ncbi:TrmH family RNA methyltransferase [Arenibaculum pallidiluteum]|uniref:TrmH family RNA methyltransferase n=1 Tax=Arenibaculum pallidiluteum TaxID=2812559 RepID=UPI001A9643C2|nr:RNA methyltransferase [Arenibaculum pallidiluteum]
MPAIIPVDDPEDPRVAAYRDVRERDLVGRQGLFMAEGEVVLRLLLASRQHRPVSLLLAGNRLAALAPLLASVPDDVPVYAAAQAVLDAVAGFHLHRGILALGRRAPMPAAGALLAEAGPRAMVVVACGIGNHDNMGGIFRNAAAFGADAVILDAGCCDPLYRKAIRVSVGAALIVPTARMEPDTDPVSLLERHGFVPVALSPAGAVPLSAMERPERVALLLGTEGPGLPANVLARARTVAIPMAPGFDSLNVATAGAIAMHHFADLARSGRPAPEATRNAP